jgi:hypothetical protein
MEWLYICICVSIHVLSLLHHKHKKIDKGDNALYCTVLYCTVLYCTVLYCTVLYCTFHAYLSPHRFAPFFTIVLNPLMEMPWSLNAAANVVFKKKGLLLLQRPVFLASSITKRTTLASPIVTCQPATNLPLTCHQPATMNLLQPFWQDDMKLCPSRFFPLFFFAEVDQGEPESSSSRTVFNVSGQFLHMYGWSAM